jgi:hypothetical protein
VFPGDAVVLCRRHRSDEYVRVVSGPAFRHSVIPLKTELVRLLDWDFVVGRI